MKISGYVEGRGSKNHKILGVESAPCRTLQWQFRFSTLSVIKIVNLIPKNPKSKILVGSCRAPPHSTCLVRQEFLYFLVKIIRATFIFGKIEC